MSIKTSPSDIRFSDIREQLKHTTSGEIKISDMLSGDFGLLSSFYGGGINYGRRYPNELVKDSGASNSGSYLNSKYVSQHNKTSYNTNNHIQGGITAWPLGPTSLSDGAAAGGTDENLNVNISEYIGTQGNIGAQTNTLNNTHQISNTSNMSSVSVYGGSSARFHRTRGKSGSVNGDAVDDCNFTQAVFTLKSFAYHAIDLPVVASAGDFIFVIAVGSTGATTTNYGSRLRDNSGNTVSNAVNLSTYGPTEDTTGSDTYQFAQFWKCGDTGVRYVDTRLYSGGAPSNATYTVIAGVVKGVSIVQSGSSYTGYGYYVSKSTSTVPYTSRLGGGRFSNNSASGTFLSGVFIAAEGSTGLPVTLGFDERRMIFNITPFTTNNFSQVAVGATDNTGALISGYRNTTTGGARFAYAIGANEYGASISISKFGFDNVSGYGGNISVPRCTGSGAETITFDIRVRSL